METGVWGLLNGILTLHTFFILATPDATEFQKSSGNFKELKETNI